MIGRQYELQCVRELLDGLTDESGVLIVEGERGVGKTTLVEQAVAHARRRGAQVLACRPGAAEKRIALRGLMELLDCVDPAAIAALIPAYRQRVRSVLRWDDVEPSAMSTQSVAEAVTALLLGMGAGGSVLIAIDDSQWMDEPSRQVMQIALHRLAGHPVGIVAAVSTPETPPTWIGEAVGCGRQRRLLLTPLPPDDMAELLAERHGIASTSEASRRIIAAAVGNAFVALEFARETQNHGDPCGDRAVIPDDVREVVAARIATLPESARATLVIAAAEPEPRCPPIDARALTPAIVAGIVCITPHGHVVFEHPLYRRVIAEAIGPRERSRAHRGAAANASDPVRRARHLARATEGESEWVADVLSSGAQVGWARGDWDSAIELADLAWRRTPARSDERIRRGVMACTYALSIGRVDVAARITAELLPFARGGCRAEVLAVRGESLLWLGSLDDAVSVLDEALTYRDIPPAAAAAVHLCLTFAFFHQGKSALSVARHAEEAVAWAERCGPGCGPRAEARATQVRIRGWHGGRNEALLAELCEMFASDGHRPVVSRPRIHWASQRAASGDLDGAIEALRAELRFAVRTRTWSADVAYLGIRLMEFAALRGARDVAAETLVQMRHAGQHLAQGLPHAAAERICAVLEASFRGDVGRARDLAWAACEGVERLGSRQLGGLVARAMGELELAGGNHEAALDWVSPVLADMLGRSPLPPESANTVADLAEVLVGVGEVPAAKALVRTCAARVGTSPPAWMGGVLQRAEAVICAAQGDLPAAARHADAAIAMLERGQHTVALGRSWLVLGQVERRRRRRAASRAAFGRAGTILAGAGAAMWLARVRDELDRPCTQGSTALLTSREQRIAELASIGMTNAQIARQITISPRTVDATLAKVYRKLGIAGRASIAGALVRCADCQEP